MKIAIICYYDGARSGHHLYQALAKQGRYKVAYAFNEMSREDYARAIHKADVIITACDSLSYIKDDKYYIYDNGGRGIYEAGSGHPVKTNAVMISMPVGKKYLRIDSGWRVAGEIWPLSEYRKNYEMITPVEPDLNYPEINDGWLPHAVDTSSISIAHKINGPMIIGAYLANRDSKNVREYLLPAIDMLQKEGLPVSLELSGTEHYVPHREFMDRMGKYAIYYGQITPIGVYGRSEVEAMAMGIPVICGITDTAVQRAGDIANYGRPCLKAYSVDDVARTIRSAIMGKINLPAVSAASRKYAERIHSYESVAKRAGIIIKEAQRRKNVQLCQGNCDRGSRVYRQPFSGTPRPTRG